ncbi:MAG: hypothetical protein HOE48_15645 [Candidatus Latescibacteria bacterium]|jgi:hypothetical protein|nr:hypothetical protein [Candidatus Latescibacterota bacterium]MBT4139354.1 hypothetical protein [Candidatus Latescibacterota bacterium]
MAKLENVNTTDIGAAIRLGCQTMCAVLNADDNHRPFFSSQVRPEAFLAFSAAHSESHVPGRHLNALLNAEHVLNLDIDETAISHHTNATFFSYSGPIKLPFNRSKIDGPLHNLRPHNVREGFHALYALAAYRNSEQALDLATESIQDILTYWSPRTGWNYEHLETQLGFEIQRSTFIVGLARSIGPLVKLYRATGLASALELALILKDKALEFFTSEGTYDRELFGTHTHSTTCVMSSLAQLADLTSDITLLHRVKAFYDNGLRSIRDDIGWVIENSNDSANPDMGECNNTGDIVETALILGQHGYPEYYQDAERILRGHLLPSQLRDTSFIEDPPNPNNEDGKHNVAKRHLGAFGFPAPYGHEPIDAKRISFNMDIVGGSVSTLCDVYRAISTADTAGHWVNLLFDHETKHIKIESPYTSKALTITVKTPKPLFVRLPSWLSPETVQISAGSKPFHINNGYLFFAQPPVNQPISLSFELPKQNLVLKHRTRDIRLELKGDNVVAMDNFGADLTFFDALQ